MSGFVDKCTTELAKLREKGQTLFSSGSSGAGPGPGGVESCQVVRPQERSSNGLMQAFATRVMCSEGSVSMLVHCFSP